MKARQLIRLLLVVTLLCATSPVAAFPQLDTPLPTIGIEVSATAADWMRIELAGWIGGSVHAAAVQENYAYVGVGPVLVVLDISNPAHPIVVGQSRMLPELVQDLAVAGNYAYVADGYGGLHIIDITNRAAPTEVGFYDTPDLAEDVALAGNYACVADGYSGLHIINVANPAAPTQVGFYDTPGYARGVALGGNYAYVTGLDPTLLILQFLWRDRVSASIPSSGGSLTSTSGDTSFAFPSGAFTAPVTLTYRHLWTDQDTGPLAGIGRTFELSAVYSDTGQVADLAPGQSFTAMLHYADAELGPAIDSTLALYAWDGSRWMQEASSVLDVVANTVSAVPNQLGLFAVLGETQRVFLPVVMKKW